MSGHCVDGIVLSQENSRKVIHIPLEQIEALAAETGRSAEEIAAELQEVVRSGAMGEGWDVSRFYNMPAEAAAECADEGWDVSRFYSMPADTSRFYSMPADVSRFYSMPADTSRFYSMPADVSRFFSMPEGGSVH